MTNNHYFTVASVWIGFKWRLDDTSWTHAAKATYVGQPGYIIVPDQWVLE